MAEACPLNLFKCGESDIDDWARKDALKRHASFRARVITAHDGEEKEEAVGLYSLKLVLEPERDLRKAHDVKRWTLHGMFPALHLEFLGVCEAHKKQGLGSFLMMDVVTTFSYLAEKAGIPVLTLYPLNKGLIPYYADRNFIPYGPGDGMMMSAETAIRLRGEV